jgi:protoheme IX farnesyltransferase
VSVMRRQISDLIELLKPTILLLNVMMAGIGMWLAPVHPHWSVWLWALVGTSLVVGSANALNMVLERDVDGLMTRTRNRPLPDGRLPVPVATAYGLSIGILGTALLAYLVNPLTAILGSIALVIYVLVYTPLKRRTTLALIVGAVPGAAPPLMGWTAATGDIALPGLALFGILLVWQIPHFLAIALYRKADYERAGIRIVPVVRGDNVAKFQTLAYATAMVPLCLLLVPLGAAGWVYGVGSLLVSLWFVWVCVRGYRSVPTAKWARTVFLASLVYLPALGAALMLDRMLL